MGRQKTYNERDVLIRAQQVFLKTGYEGTSLDDLVASTGLLRGSLYAAFGSKRGIFLAVLRLVVEGEEADVNLDFVLVSLLELAPRDAEVRILVEGFLEKLPDAAVSLGKRLIARAGIKEKKNEQ